MGGGREQGAARERAGGRIHHKKSSRSLCLQGWEKHRERGGGGSAFQTRSLRRRGGDEFTDWRRSRAGLLSEREAHPRGSVEKSWYGGRTGPEEKDFLEG